MVWCKSNACFSKNPCSAVIFSSGKEGNSSDIQPSTTCPPIVAASLDHPWCGLTRVPRPNIFCCASKKDHFTFLVPSIYSHSGFVRALQLIHDNDNGVRPQDCTVSLRVGLCVNCPVPSTSIPFWKKGTVCSSGCRASALYPGSALHTWYLISFEHPRETFQRGRMSSSEGRLFLPSPPGPFLSSLLSYQDE